MTHRALRVALFYDVPGWAWWHKAIALTHCLPRRFAVELVQIGKPFDHERYDYLILFGGYMVAYMGGVPENKLVLGLTATRPRYVESVRGHLLAGRVRAAFANSLIGFEGLAGAGRTFLCQNGVDTEFFRPTDTPPEEFSLCWVGNPNSGGEKGLHLIQETCERLGVTLVFHAWDASRGDTAGIISHQRVRDTIYHRSSAYACASMSEATPNPALESLACGLPVLTTPVGNMPEVIRDGVNGCFIERSVEGIAEGIERLRSADLAAMSKAARASVDPEWSWPNRAMRYAAMLDELACEDGLAPEEVS